MEPGLQIKEAAKKAVVDEDTIIGWEVRNVKPKKEKLMLLLRFYRKKGAKLKNIDEIIEKNLLPL